MPQPKSGEITSEFRLSQLTSSGASWLMWIGVAGAIASAVGEAFGADTRVGVIAGATAAVIAKIVQMLIALGYTQSRTRVKEQAEATTREDIRLRRAAIAASPPTPSTGGGGGSETKTRADEL